MKTFLLSLVTLVLLAPTAALASSGAQQSAPPSTVGASPVESASAAHAAAPAKKKKARKMERRILKLVNRERKAHELSKLKPKKCVTTFARKWSTTMDRRDIFRHSNLRKLFTACPQATRVGENIAMGHRSPKQVVKAWMKSPGHRANILRSEWKFSGLGVRWDKSRKVWLYTHNFAR